MPYLVTDNVTSLLWIYYGVLRDPGNLAPIAADVIAFFSSLD